jgi:hypothetical protein
MAAPVQRKSAKGRAGTVRIVIWRRVLVGLVTVVACLWMIGGAAAARTGRLVVVVSGLPAGERPAAVLSGPGVHRRVRGQRLVVGRARSGVYTLTLSPVRLTRSVGTVRRGALASPAARRVAVRVGPGKTGVLVGRYGSIVNPGVVSVRAGAVAVGGAAADPSSVTFAGRRGLKVGEVLSLAPSGSLPRGVLKRIVAVRYASGHTTVTLMPVSVYAVMPVAQFDVPLAVGAGTAGGAADRAVRKNFSADCGPSLSGMSGVYRTVKNARFSGGWNTVSVFGAHIPIGVNVTVNLDLDAGIKDEVGAEIGVSCEVDIPFSGMAGPIPVTGAVFGDVHASVGGGVGFKADVSAHLSAGASTVGTPPVLVWVPHLSVSHPSANVSAVAEVEATAGFGAGVKAGLGNEDIAAATLNFNNDLDFTAQASAPDGSGCAVQFKFASFNAEGKLGAWTIESPSTPPLFTKTLWGPKSCEPHPSQSSGTVSVSIYGPPTSQFFSAKLDGRVLPESLGQTIARFGQPASEHRYGQYGENCDVSWPTAHVTGTFTTALGGTYNGCAPGAGTVILTLGPGWRTDTGLSVGQSVANLRRLYPAATATGNDWTLVQYFYGAGYYVTELGAMTSGGTITALTVAGVPNE